MWKEKQFMLQRLRNRVGTAGLIVAIVALVAALAGGAYAASGALTGKQKKEVEKIAKKYAGKQGPAGPQGPQGSKGDAGNAGQAGAAGASGKSITVTPIAVGTPGLCESSGGASVKQEGAGSGTAVCNGEEGPEGPKGEPWAVGGLPKGATETGAWSFNGTSSLPGVNVPISFPVPLKASLAASAVHFVGPTGGGVCTGNAANPTAPEGALCVYENRKSGASFGAEGGVYELSWEALGASKQGAYIYFETVAVEAYGFGSWAVTGS
jgi:hypothetical protein